MLVAAARVAQALLALGAAAAACAALWLLYTCTFFRRRLRDAAGRTVPGPPARLFGGHLYLLRPFIAVSWPCARTRRVHANRQPYMNSAGICACACSCAQSKYFSRPMLHLSAPYDYDVIGLLVRARVACFLPQSPLPHCPTARRWCPFSLAACLCALSPTAQVPYGKILVLNTPDLVKVCGRVCAASCVAVHGAWQGVLNGSHWDYPKSPQYAAFHRAFGLNGLVTTNGATWKQHR